MTFTFAPGKALLYSFEPPLPVGPWTFGSGVPGAGEDLLSRVPSSAVVVLCTSPRRDSRSSQVARTIAGLVGRQYPVPVIVVDLVDLPLVPLVEREVDYPPVWREVLGLLRRVDRLVLAAPVHRNRVAGLTRHVLEIGRDGLAGASVLPVVAAGSSRSHLAAERLRAELLSDFRATPLPAVVITPDMTREAVLERSAAAADLLVTSRRAVTA